MNNIVRPIFNKKSCWKVEFVGPWTVYECTIHRGKVNKCGLKKKKEENAENENADAQTLKPNGYYVSLVVNLMDILS